MGELASGKVIYSKVNATKFTEYSNLHPMRFSLKALILISTWTAWLFGALAGGHPWIIESFIAFQYLLLALSVTLALTADRGGRLLATCFAAGFVSWLLLLVIEAQCADLQTFRNTIPGSRLDVAARWISDYHALSDAMSQVRHYNKVISALRATIGTVFGVLTYFGALLVFKMQASNTAKSG